MPKKEKNTIAQPTTNDAGKIYPWALEGKDFAYYKSVNMFLNMITPTLSAINKEEYGGKLSGDLRDLTKDNDPYDEQFGNTLCVNFDKGVPAIELAPNAQMYIRYISSGKIPQADKIYQKAKDSAEELFTHLRSVYEGKTDPASIHMEARMDRYIQTIRLAEEAYDPAAGNTIKAEMNAPHLIGLNSTQMCMPKFEKAGVGFEGCVQVMDQLGTGGGSIFDDYMTIMDSYANGLKVQYHRQQMEKTGWDAEKERIYLNELRLENQKVVEAYDNLWMIDDKGQYDKVLGNALDEIVGKKEENQRDYNTSIGYMRGEVRAIDLGYDSKHLYILGQVGLQDQALKKRQSEINLGMESADGAKREKLQKQQEELDEYKKDFEQLKENLWNKKVTGKEEMEASEKLVDDFFRSHQEKYAELQFRRNSLQRAFDNLHEDAVKSQPVVTTPRLNTKDLSEMLQMGITINDKLDGADHFPGLFEKIYETFNNGAKKENKIIPDSGKKNKTQSADPLSYDLTPEYDLKSKKLLAEIRDKIENYQRTREKDPKHPAADALRAGYIDTVRFKAESLQAGIRLTEDKSGMEPGYWAVESLFPQFNGDMMKQENADKLENALKNYPLHKMIPMGIELQSLQNEYDRKEAGMTQKEKDAFRESMLDKKSAFLDLAKDLYRKSLNPSPETLSLFGAEKQLTDMTNGFIGERGLANVIRSYEAELVKTAIPQAQMNALDESVAKFNTSRASVFKNESDEHKDLREMTEKVRENLNKLQSGRKEDGSGKAVAMTADEKQDLMAETIDQLNRLNMLSEAYIVHSTKDGKTPGTPAGKTRLEGARELKDLANKLQDSLMKEQQHDMRRERNAGEKEAGNDKRQHKRIEGGLEGLKKQENSDKKEKPDYSALRHSVHEKEKAKEAATDTIRRSSSI